MGFAMSMRQSQSTSACHPSVLFTVDWVDFRGTWRTLLFLSRQVIRPSCQGSSIDNAYVVGFRQRLDTSPVPMIQPFQICCRYVNPYAITFRL